MTTDTDTDTGTDTDTDTDTGTGTDTGTDTDTDTGTGTDTGSAWRGAVSARQFGRQPFDRGVEGPGYAGLVPNSRE